MPLQYDGLPLRPAHRVAFNEREGAPVQWASSFVSHHGDGMAIDRMRAIALAVHYFAATTGGVTQTDR